MTAAITLAAPCSIAHADPAPTRVQLEWIAPDECPSRAAFASEIARLLGRALDESPPAALRVRGEITRPGGGPYRVVVQTEGADGAGERALEDPVCAQLADAAAVVVALAIDPDAVLETQRKDHEPPPPPLPPPPPPPPSVRERAVHVGGGLMALVDVGTLPNPAPGVGLAVYANLGRHVRAELWAATFVPQDVPTGSGLPGGAHVHPLVFAGLRGCASPAWSRVELGACAGVEAGAISAAGFGISNPATTTGPWGAVSVGGLFAVRITPWFAVRVGAEAAFAWMRPNFTVRAFRGGDLTDIDVYAPSAIVGRGTLGIEFRN